MKMTPDYKLVLYISEIIRKWKWLEISDATALMEIRKELMKTYTPIEEKDVKNG